MKKDNSLKVVVSVDGSKGGVGKSVVAAAVIDTIVHHLGKKVLIVEADTANPDIMKAHGGMPCIALNLDRDAGFIDAANAIAAADAEYVVISNPARSGAGWRAWGDLLVGHQTELGIDLRVLWVLGRQRDSIEALLDFREAAPGAVLHPAINTYWGDAPQFELWNSSQARADTLAAGGKEIIFPGFADRVSDFMRQHRLSWAGGDAMPIGNRLELSRARKLAWAALAPIL